MAQLTTLDAGFCNTPAPNRYTGMTLGAVAIVDGAAPSFDLFRSLLAERIQSIPRCTQVLRTDWIDYPGFDLSQHVRRAALPRPGDEADLFQTIAHALERPLDPNRPLWDCWIIEGLKNDQWAILMKIHHCMADDISAAHILAKLCDDADSDTFASHKPAEHVLPSHPKAPSWADTLRQASVAVTATAVKAAARTVSVATETASAMIRPGMWPTTPLTTMRRYSTVRISRAAVDSVCHKFGVTTDDVALAAITEGFRTLLLRSGQQPRADSLRTVSQLGNQLSAVLPYLPVEHDDPVQRLRAVQTRSNTHGQSDRRQSGVLPPTPNQMLFMLRAKAIQALTRMPQPGVVTLATNSPGPRHRLRLLGQRIERLLPIPPTAPKLSTGVAVLSYGDELVFGITADYHAAPEMKRLAASVERGLARLVALSQDSVLLFPTDRPRKRPSRSLPGNTHHGRTSTSTIRARR